ncbi:MAG TPA: trypsin-like peptidase domain-containing protein [Clostridia bacterium]|nr:trypsin-like peptidase domain-containing protein [Clostridia bacterium]
MRKKTFSSPFLLALFSAIIGGLLVAALGFAYLQPDILKNGHGNGNTAGYNSNLEASPSNTVLTPEEAAVTAAVKKVGPAVVNINTTVVRQTFWGLQSGKGSGSGAIIDPDGYIVTNNHVIDDASNINVTLVDGRKFRGTLVGSDPDRDIAVVKIQATDLPVVQLGDSDKLEVGQTAIAIGNPYSFDFTVTTGVVSAVGRHVEIERGRVLEGLIQTNAAINPGNSGGPLVNSSGHVIGINTLLYTGEMGNAQGIGFALPVNMVSEVARNIIDRGESVEPTPWLGIYMTNLSENVAQRQGLSVDGGVIIAFVVPESPAQKSGLLQGDIIIGSQEKVVRNTEDLSSIISKSKIGGQLSLIVLRDGKEIEVKAILE